MKKLLAGLTLAIVLFAFAAPPGYAAEDSNGFAKYLPDDTVMFSSTRNGKKFIDGIINSNWARKLMTLDTVKSLIGNLPDNYKPENLKKFLEMKPMLKNALSGVEELFSHEVTEAVTAKSADDALAMLQAVFYAAFAYEGNMPFPPAMKNVYAKKSADQADKLIALLKEWDFPSYVIAFKVEKPDRAKMATTLLDQLAADNMKNMAKMLKIGEKNYFGIGAAVGDFLPAPIVKQMLSNVQAFSQEGRDDKLIEALSAKTLCAYWGFVGGYFVITIGPDDTLLKTIVANASGGAEAKVLADKPEFKALASRVKPSTLSLRYYDLAQIGRSYDARIRPGLLALPNHAALEYLLPDVKSMNPDKIVSDIDRGIRSIFALAASGWAITDVEDGLKTYSESRIDLDGLKKVEIPAPESTELNIVKLVPASALMFAANHFSDMSYAWEQIKSNVSSTFQNQKKNAMKYPNPYLQKQFAMLEEAGAELEKIFEKYFVKGVGGQSAVFIDELGKIDRLEEMRNFPVPMGAMIFELKDPDLVEKGSAELMKYIGEFVKKAGGRGLPELQTLTHGDRTIYYYQILEGDFEPNAFIVGNYAVLSSSLKTSKKIIDLFGGKGRDVTTTASYKAVSGVFKPRAYTSVFIDFTLSVEHLGRFANYVLDFVEEKNFSGTVLKSEWEQFRMVRTLIQQGLDLLTVFKSFGYNETVEGNISKKYMHLKVEDFDK